jgi:hypothetical protein
MYDTSDLADSTILSSQGIIRKVKDVAARHEDWPA